MKLNKIVLLGIAFCILTLAGCSGKKGNVLFEEAELPSGTAPVPSIPREFRAAWVATVDNIDWPSKRGLPAAQQQAEMLAILDRAVSLNMNALIFQVRPAADAMYESKYEPWSEFLTGQQGRRPEPFYDPLEFAITEAHKRGLELHAWFNPYRAWHPGEKGQPASNYVGREHPNWVKQYGTFQWMDPGNPDVADHSTRVIMDVVKRYDVDGIHMDDYFYPYPAKDASGRDVEFPDDESYRRSGTRMSKNDWRRDNVNQFVQRLYREIKAEKRWVKFGISPFGIWRPGNPSSVVGFDQYDKLYADAKLWLNQGWVDYFTPQLYWAISSPGQSYSALLNWWIGENGQQRHIWPGNYASRVIAMDNTKWNVQEILDQVRMTQNTQGSTGNVQFSMKALMPQNGRLGEALRQELYANRVLVPASPWLDKSNPEKPKVALKDDRGSYSVEMSMKEAPTKWVVRALYNGQWMLDVISGAHKNYALPVFGLAKKPDWVAISSLNRSGVEGAMTVVRWKVPKK